MSIFLCNCAELSKKKKKEKTIVGVPGSLFISLFRGRRSRRAIDDSLQKVERALDEGQCDERVPESPAQACGDGGTKLNGKAVLVLDNVGNGDLGGEEARVH